MKLNLQFHLRPSQATGIDGIAPYSLKISKTSTAPVVLFNSMQSKYKNSAGKSQTYSSV